MSRIGQVVTFWINAFIPDNVPDYTQRITTGEASGKSAVPMPGVAKLAWTNLTQPSGTGFLTDQRTFSSNSSASVRMQSLMGLQPYPMSVTGQMHSTSGTVQVTIPTGKIEAQSIADMSKCEWSGPLELPRNWFNPHRYYEKSISFSAFRTPYPSRGNYTALFHVSGAASDPLVTFSADINYDGYFTVEVRPDDNYIAVEFD